MARVSNKTCIATLICVASVLLLPNETVGQDEGGGSITAPAREPWTSARADAPPPPQPDREANADDPADTTPTLSGARDLLTEGQYERAIEAYRTLATNPLYADEARIGLAIGRIRIGEYDSAIECLLNEPRALARADFPG